MNTRKMAVLGWVAVLSGLLGTAAGQVVTIETVPVGNSGNTGEWSGESYGGYGPDRICGGVDYEYDIGKYEVTTGQYTAFLNAVAKNDPYGLYVETMWSDPISDGTKDYACKIKRTGSPGYYSYSVTSAYADRPVSHVSWADAVRFANWMHNGQPVKKLTGSPSQDADVTEDGAYLINGATDNVTLQTVTRKSDCTWAVPTEDEWYKAAYHKNDGVTANYYDYATGSDTKPSNQLTDPDAGNNATYGYFTSGDVLVLTIGSPYYRTEAGEHENSESPYGTYDQAGNVEEWCDTFQYSSSRILRGGNYYYDGAIRASVRYGHFPNDDYRWGGFRLVYIPEPTSMVLMALCGVGMLRRRRTRK